MLSASASFKSITRENGAEVNKLTDSDDGDSGIQVLPTPKAKRLGQTGGFEAPVFACLDDEQDGGNTELEDSDGDSLPDPANASQAILNHNRHKSVSCAASPLSTPHVRRSASTTSVSIPCVKRKSTRDISHFDDGDDAHSSLKKKRAKKDPVQARLEKEAKARSKQASAEEKKRNKAEAVQRKKLEKAEEKERKDAERAKEKESKVLNKLVSSRNDTLKDMTIEFTPALLQNPSPLLNAIPKIRARILEENKEANATISSPITTFHPEPPLANILNLVRWKRRIVSKYDDNEKEWKPVEEAYDRIEGSWLLYWTLKDLASQVQNPGTEQISKSLAALRAHLGSRYQLFLLIDHSGNQWSKLSQDVRNQVEAHLVTLQVEHNCFVIRAQDSEDLVRRFFDLTADLGFKPHKLIERSHLAFCSKIKKSDAIGINGSAKIYHRMLQQIYRVTDPIADNITKDTCPTLRSLLEAYEQPQMTARRRDNLLVGVEMGNNRKVGSAISSRIAAVFTGEDSLSLVGK
ncbi:hypothetical protein FRB96_005573 [Tulasnella sp. 330]|nr:hypothetical protein FRB96_005573 [Tulasnella sp. 330]KAG8883960.1 hypothetical protein FRB98_002668 [Tulasnella sp. 332]